MYAPGHEAGCPSSATSCSATSTPSARRLERQLRAGDTGANCARNALVLLFAYLFLDLPKLSDKLQSYIDTTGQLGGWSANCVQVGRQLQGWCSQLRPS
jgi:hypothetical protein